MGRGRLHEDHLRAARQKADQDIYIRCRECLAARSFGAMSTKLHKHTPDTLALETAKRGKGRTKRPFQWIGVETIAPATPAPVAHIVSKMWLRIDASLTRVRSTLQTRNFDFLCFSPMTTSLICSPTKRKTDSRATRAIAAVGFEPTPIPEEEWPFRNGK